MDSNNRALWIGLAVIIIVGLFYFGIMPQNRTLTDKRMQGAVKKTEADALTQRIAALGQFQTQLTSQKAEYDKLKIAFPQEAKPEEIFYMIQAMASKSGLTVENIQPTQGQSDKTGDTVDISVTLTGDFKSFTTMTDEIGKNIRPTFIKNITMAAKDEANQSKVSGTFDLGFLIVRPAAVSAAAANQGVK